MNKWGLILSVLVMFVVFIGANYYIGKRLIQWAKLIFPSINQAVLWCVYILLIGIMIAAFIPLPEMISSIANGISAYWMGVFIYLLLLFMIVDIALLILMGTKVLSSPLPSQVRLWASSLAIGLSVIVVIYGLYNATLLKEVRYTIETNDTVQSPNLKIALISDLHLGAIGSEKRIPEMVARINEMEPDLIIMAGDIFNDDFNTIKNPERIKEEFLKLDATYGVYGTLGNHDGGKTHTQMVVFLADSNVQLLRDEIQQIEDKVILVGRVDPSPIGGFNGMKRKDMSSAIQALDPAMPVIVIDHTPSNLDQYDGLNVDLIVSGHTHKGQLFPGSLITNLVFEVDYGYYQKDKNSPNVVVSSGVGTWGMPMRVGTNTEIVEILLK